MLHRTAHFSLRGLHLETKSRKKLALSKKPDMRNHMQMTEIRVGSPVSWNERNNVRLTIGLNSMNELKSRVFSKLKPGAAGLCRKSFFVLTKKLIQTFVVAQINFARAEDHNPINRS